MAVESGSGHGKSRERVANLFLRGGLLRCSVKNGTQQESSVAALSTFD